MVNQKQIPEYEAVSTLNIVADGAIAGAGLPVVVYVSSTGLKGIVKALAADSDLQGVQYGLSIEAISSGKETSIIIAGAADVATAGGTTGQVITAISSAGACTTKTAASALLADTIYGVKTDTTEVVLVS